MKKILLSCVTCLLALGLVTACDSEEEDVNGSDSDTPSQDTGTSGGTTEGGGTTQGGGTTEAVTLTNYTVSFSFVDEDGNVTTLEDGYTLYLQGSWSTDENGTWIGWIACEYNEDTGYYVATFESIDTGTYTYKGISCLTGYPSWTQGEYTEVITNATGGDATLVVSESDEGGQIVPPILLTEIVILERNETVNVHLGVKNSGASGLNSGVYLYARAGYPWSEDHGGDSPEEGWDVWYNNASVPLEADTDLPDADLWCVVEDWDSSIEFDFVFFASSSSTATSATDYWTAYILPSTTVDGATTGVDETGEENLLFWTTLSESDHHAGLSLDYVSNVYMGGVTDIYVVFTFDFSAVSTSSAYSGDISWSVTTASIASSEDPD